MNPDDDLLGRLSEHVELGHAARNQAFLRQVSLALSCVGGAVIRAANQQRIPTNDLISFYRFCGNEAIDTAHIRRARAQTVLEYFEPTRRVAVIHDVTQLDYTRHGSKLDRRLIGDHGGQGYEYVACAAADPQAKRIVGLVHDTVVNANGPDDADVMDYDYEPMFADFDPEEKKRLRENHKHQMAVHVRGLRSLLAPFDAVHVADREFDDIFILNECFTGQENFVIRATGNRNVQVQDQPWIPERARAAKQQGHPLPEGYIYVNLGRLIDALPMRPYKRLPLDKHNRVVDPKGPVHRWADLCIAACQVRLYRNAKRNKKYFKTHQPLDVNLVVIREINPPQGAAPVLWKLFTSLPIESEDQCRVVGELYELRWKIEDYFRLLKSGYQIERDRHDTAEDIAKILVVLSIAAMVILGLKAWVGLASQGRLSDEDYARLKQAMLEPNNSEIDLGLRLFAHIAKVGGWLGRRGDPIGPLVLMRGMLSVMPIFQALAHCPGLIEQALRNPNVLGGIIRV